MCGAGDARKLTFEFRIGKHLEQKFCFLLKIHFLVRAHQTNNKNEIVAPPTNHGDAHFGPAQQPTNNPEALV
jgi:hypothetical protein